MYNLLISLALFLLVFLGLKVGDVLPWWGALILGLLAAAGSFLAITLLVKKKVDKVQAEAMKILQPIQAQRVASREIAMQLIEKAVKELKGGLAYSRWMFFLDSQINAGIGSLYFSVRDFTTSYDYLNRSASFNQYFRNWEPLGMLAVCCLKRRRPEEMEKVFEKAVMGGGKQPLLWNLYSYCLVEAGKTPRAVEVMERGLKKTANDRTLTQNLELLRQGKGMKMDDYGDKWLQFQLESIAKLQKQQMAAMGGMKRRVVRR
jgi:tetratricopeptide (TPR) repeat protein